MAGFAEGLAQIYGGFKAKQSAKFEARQLEQQAMADRAASQRAANEERRRARRLYSTALARAAASGGGVDNANVSKILSEIDAEGEYRALSQQWKGETVAMGREMQARTRRREGSAAQVAGALRGISTMASAAMKV